MARHKPRQSTIEEIQSRVVDGEWRPTAHVLEDIFDGLFTEEVAKSGCCKARKSDKHPWIRNGMGYQQCEDINKSDGDPLFKKSGKYWWDRSC